MKKLTPNEIEAVNRAEATALLIRTGYRVYRPEADCDGEDLILRTASGEFYPVQLKVRPTVDLNKFGKKGLVDAVSGNQAQHRNSKELVSRSARLIPSMG